MPTFALRFDKRAELVLEQIKMNTFEKRNPLSNEPALLGVIDARSLPIGSPSCDDFLHTPCNSQR